ncbi:hypothetical protein D3C75_1247420 [compost metagenome]
MNETNEGTRLSIAQQLHQAYQPLDLRPLVNISDVEARNSAFLKITSSLLHRSSLTTDNSLIPIVDTASN